MTFPIVLAPEEVDCLRLMVRAVIATSIHTATANHRQRLSASPRTNGEAVDTMFAGHMMEIADSYRNLDLPLFHAATMCPGKTVIVDLTKDGFEALKDVATKDYMLEPNPDEDALQFMNRIRKTQPHIIAAFKAAEEQAARATVEIKPNVVPNMCRN